MNTTWQRKTNRSGEVLDDGSCYENNNEIGNAKALDGFVKF